ncbi:formate dehydrogenase subunit gamma [Thermincola potens]|uniref:Cytochrome b561 bacterial/Ni-hydrogenase domain-containing protein n=1 Tax=Thermincola potens (strain JR) TaxID=635013 RepID=D5X7B4_THEPJ|nr:cytochrome b/b6 domain-containing protein [Thermincola potens]ADG82484.1 conserved hypothetical protein [Thermincola potens JR]
MKILHDENKVLRQCLANRIIHWSVAVSTFILLFTGFGQMPLYKRYKIADIPGLGWSADFSITLYWHYIAAIILIFAVTYHVFKAIFMKEFSIFPRRGDFKQSALIIGAMCGLCEEPPSDKYLAEQRLAYAFIGGNLLLVIFTGMIKVLKNLPSVDFSATFLAVVTNLHNLAAVLILFGIVAHLFAFVFKQNRALLPAMFSGKVDIDYCRHRHSIWYSQLERKCRKETV